MNVHIYATTQRRTFLAVRFGTRPPAQATRLFKRLTLETGKPRVCLDPDEVMFAIERQGWAVIDM